MTPPATTPLFTAAQIARACAVSRQCVQAWQRKISPDGVAHVNGQETNAWLFASLPSRVKADLQRIAKDRGFRSVELLLQNAPQPWTPPKPLDQVAQEFKDKAVKLREVLSPFLVRQHNTPSGHLAAEGLAAFRAAFGYDISAKTWQRRLDLATKRDGGAENWQRLDLYIEDAAFHQAEPTSPARQPWNHAALEDAFEQVENKAKPTLEDRAYFFDAAFRHYETLTAAHTGQESKVKKSIVGHMLQLFPAPALAKTAAAFLRKFEYKLNQWRDGGRTPDALMDRRRMDSGNFRTPDFAEDLKKIRDRAIQLDGNEALAHQMLRDAGKLSPEFCAYYRYEPRLNKSYLARTIRDRITPQVEATLPLRHSPRALSIAGPSTTRDWSGELPGDWFTADDVSWNHLYKVRRPDGGWDVLRGECLVMTDAKTDYPIEFLLIAGKYNSEHIRQLMLRAHDAVGLPRKGFIFERGVWSSRLIKGISKSSLHWRCTDDAVVNQLNLAIDHTWTPKGKPIEGVFRRVQERMRCIAGFVGFNEMVEKREDIQKLIDRARRARGDDDEALAFFPTQEQWRDRITAELDDFRRSPSNGERIPGLTPAEAWNEAQLDHPQRRLSMETRYLLATHCQRIRLTPRQGREGIVVKIRGTDRTFANGKTGDWYHAGVKEVLTFYNIEQPDLLTISDVHRQEFFTVKELRLPAKSATREQLAEVASAKRAHLAPARAIFGQIKHDVVSTQTRDNEHEEAKDLGRFHNAAVEQHKAEESEENKLKREINRLTDTLGAPRTDFATLRVSLRQKRDALQWKANLRAGQTREPSATL